MTTTTNETPVTGTGSTETTGAGATERHSMPQAKSREGGGGTGIAPLKGNSAQVLQQVLFYAGAVLLPSGLIVIGLGWYGVANTPYEYDQNAYIVSGGILGLGITFVGGFLYFGSWLARIALDQREAQAQLTDAIRLLAASNGTKPEATHLHAPVPAAATTAAPAAPATPAAPAVEAGPVRVVAGRGKTLHRPDCDLIAGREDITVVADATGLVPCRLCLS